MEASTVSSALYVHWICQYGTPLSITTDQGTQFESALFSALARLVGARVIHTTPYHPQSNGIVERFHRTLKAALMCQAPTPWTEVLPTVLLGLRTCLKEDLNASPAELLYGTALRIPGEFFTSETLTSDPQIFLETYREHIRKVRPTATAHHIKSRCFVLKDLATCTHFFRRVDSVRRPLEPPYTGPHEVIRRINDRVYCININGVEKTISVDALKPAYTLKPETATSTLENSPASSFIMDRPLRTYAKEKKKVSFLPQVASSLGGE